jgi:hypothetical protein
MSETHDYETKMVKATALNGTHVIVGECGGLSAVFDVEPSSAIPGLYRVESEHGVLYLDPDQKIQVLEDHEPVKVDLESHIDVSVFSLAVAFEQDIYDMILTMRMDAEDEDTSLAINDNPFTVTSIETDSDKNKWIRINFTAHYTEAK